MKLPGSGRSLKYCCSCELEKTDVKRQKTSTMTAFIQVSIGTKSKGQTPKENHAGHNRTTSINVEMELKWAM